MECDKPDQTVGRAVPWDRQPAQVVEDLKQRIGFDRLIVGIIDPNQPRPDEILVVHGWSEDEVQQWLNGGFHEDHLLRHALEHAFDTLGHGHGGNGFGSAVAEPEAREHTPLAPHSFTTTHVLPETPIAGVRRWWWLTMVRHNRPFEQVERQHADLLLRGWQCAFSHVDEPEMNRLLYGHDHRLILADLMTQMHLLREPALPEDLFSAAQAIVQQRWPALPDDVTADVVVELQGRRAWVCLRRTRAITGEQGTRYVVLARTLEPDDLPPVGVVEDDRIARAIAHIHENFQQSPSLAQIARQVHVSPFHFHRLFTRQVGTSPKQYLQKKQLQVARWMLRATRLPISTIARQAGFASHGHFTSTFHRAVGKSPREYREAEVGG